jgi:hypothetical protein
LGRASPLEAKYLIKIITGELRIGLRESLVEEAIAKAYDANYAEVRRANMMLGDISLALRMAAERRLAEATKKMRLFHPVGVMLASPVESAEKHSRISAMRKSKTNTMASARRRILMAARRGFFRGRAMTSLKHFLSWKRRCCALTKS